MTQQSDLDDDRWQMIASSADDNGLVRTIVQLSIETGATIEVTFDVPGDSTNRRLTVSTATYPDLIADPTIADPDRMSPRAP